MRSLFLKIFLSFWGAQALFVILAVLVTIAMRPARDPNAANTQSRILNEVVTAYQNEGQKGAGEALEEAQQAQHEHVFVLDASGREISGRLTPPWLQDGTRPRMHQRSWFERLFPNRVIRYRETIAGQPYTLVLEQPPGPRIFMGPHGFPTLGLIIGVISSGLVCYLLAWSLTSPVARLRKAAQQLAAGDLSARAGAPVGGRRDELAELMRDFDRMAERIEGLMDAQSRLLKDVSHELRSPLARLNVALALARQKSTPEAEGALARIEIEAERLNQLIQRLLTISRLEAGADGIRKATLPLRELVEHIARDAEYETPGRQCVVEADRNDTYTVQADSDLLGSAIENVVRNATRYTANGKPVEIRMERDNTNGHKDIVVRVLDSGPGVPESDLEKIFQPFYRVDDVRNQQTGGAGLGLSIADRAVRLHGGSVRASNRKQGGLEVEIRIPESPAFALPAYS